MEFVSLCMNALETESGLPLVLYEANEEYKNEWHCSSSDKFFLLNKVFATLQLRKRTILPFVRIVLTPSSSRVSYGGTLVEVLQVWLLCFYEQI